MARETFTDTYLVLVLQFMVLLLPSLFTGTLCNLGAPQHQSAGRGCVASEREALLLFKSQLQDPAGELLSWSGGDCCRWKGVGCDNRTGHVVMLDLHNNNASDYFYINYTWALTGEIHPSLHHLEHLQHLDLSGNDFGSRSIPKFIGSFMELMYLNLSGTSLVGTVPVQLGNLSNLQFLDLSYNFGLALSDGGFLAQLSSLEYVDMSGVNLGNSNNWLQALNVLPSISVIRLQQCRIESFPQSVPHVNFTSLTTLVLSENYMFNSTFPDWLFRMSNLEHLDLRNTPSDTVVSNMGVIPLAIEHLHKLRFLDFSGDLLGGSIPESLGSLSLLQEINLSQNNLTGFIPKSLERLSSLKTLDLYTNSLRGTIPGSLGRLTSLQKLDLSSNNLSGPIPTSIGRLTLLQHLNLHSNAFSGSVPTSLGLLRSVQELDVSRNALGGSIPESLCGLHLVKKLDLSWNDKMNGTIPECIWQLAQMEGLGLGGNGLEGVILDSHFSNLTRLDSLTITSSKSLVLDISSDWIPPFSLSLLYLLTCQVGPKFPKWIQTQDKFIGLSLRKVGINESLPLWIWNFSSTLTVIDFYAKELSGKLPDATHSPSLSIINLSFNRLEGFAWLSDIWKMMPNLQYLLLNWNNVYGTIPASLCKLNLQRLDLSSNHFSGRIPGCLMKLHIYLNLEATIFMEAFQQKVTLCVPSFLCIWKIIICQEFYLLPSGVVQILLFLTLDRTSSLEFYQPGLQKACYL